MSNGNRSSFDDSDSEIYEEPEEYRIPEGSHIYKVKLIYDRLTSQLEMFQCFDRKGQELLPQYYVVWYDQRSKQQFEINKGELEFTLEDNERLIGIKSRKYKRNKWIKPRPFQFIVGKKEIKQSIFPFCFNDHPMILRYLAKQDIKGRDRLSLSCDICNSTISIWEGYYTCDNPDCDVDFCTDCVQSQSDLLNNYEMKNVQALKNDSCLNLKVINRNNKKEIGDLKKQQVSKKRKTKNR